GRIHVWVAESACRFYAFLTARRCVFTLSLRGDAYTTYVAETALGDSRPRSDVENVAVRTAMPLVLLVEDDRRMRKYLSTTLADQRLRVVDAQTGAEALMQASGHNPDLVILDFVLPDMDGIQVTTKLREWTAAPILILSARDEESEKVSALDAGAND